MYFGTPEQKAKYLPRLASADLIGAYALTEPQSGSDALAAKTTARLTPDGSHYLLNGQKAWITNGGFADLFTVFAKVDGEKFTAFIVERGMGVESGPDEKKLGLDGSSTTVLMLDNVPVPVENVLGTIGEGHKVAFNILNLGRVKLGTRNIAGVRQALNQSIAYAQAAAAVRQSDLRVRPGQAEARRDDRALFRQRGDGLSHARRRGQGARGSGRGGTRPGCSRPSRRLPSSARLIRCATSEALAYAVDEAVQVFGGNGYSREFPVERAYRDARITRIYEGTNEINRLIIATRLLKNTESFLAPGAGETATGSVLETERHALVDVKRLAQTALAAAAQTFGAAVREEQELLAHIANVVIECYAIESAIGRAEKMTARGNDRATIAVDIARIYTSDAMDRVAHAGKQIVNALAGGAEGIDTLTEAVARVREHPGTDTVGARRRVADAAIAQSRYPF